MISPLVGFGMAALLLLVMKFVIRNKALYEEPKGNNPPPLWIRALLICTCTGVSFAHGSERRSERNGADHADPDRSRSDGLRPEPHA